MSQPADPPLLSVVVPARDAAATLAECLTGLASQTFPREAFEVIVAYDPRSRDETLAIARSFPVMVVSTATPGAGAARNVGLEVARGTWVAFVDADVVPSRGWLSALMGAVQALPDSGPEAALGAAGLTIGRRSTTAAARYVDLTGGLRADKHLAHERYPWAPTGNVMYRRAALAAVGGFDPRFVAYEGCDLHTRLRRQVGGEFTYVERAVVLHRHREGWRAYWRQQVSYGRGYGQFFRCYAPEIGWGLAQESRAWLAAGAALLRALVPAHGDAGVLRRGAAVKQLAQRIGFVLTYWSPREARRWRRDQQLPAGNPN